MPKTPAAQAMSKVNGNHGKKAELSSRSSRPGGAQRNTTPALFAHITGPRNPVPSELVKAVSGLEAAMGNRVVMFIQAANGAFGNISDFIFHKFLKEIDELPYNEPVTILLHSPGGQADAAYRLSQLFRLRCGGYNVVIPIYAKSAATLFALGENEITLGTFAELGPLDAQLDDMDREQRLSALEVTQSLERLNSEAMQAVDAQMIFWANRSGKRIETLLPIATKFVAEMMRPLFEKIDTVHYTKMARILKVAQDYAERLLGQRMPHDEAQGIAQTLTQAYAEHGFVIDAEELDRIGLELGELSENVANIIDPLAPFLQALQGNYIGLLKEVSNAQENKQQETKNPATAGS
jgi:hypothetical protein